MNATKTFCCAGLLAVLWSGLAQALPPPQVFSDTFSDSKLDKTLWIRANGSTGKFQENGGHLRVFSNPTNDSLNQVARLFANSAYKYNKGDTISIYGTVRVPHKIPSNPGGSVSNSYEVGIGLYQSMTNANYVELLVEDSQSNRQFGIYYSSQSLGSTHQYWPYDAPTNINVFKLRLTYSCATDMIGFYWSPVTSNTWTKIRPPLKMTDLFGPFPVKIMDPYVIGYAENIIIPRGWNVWIDDFMAVYRDRPL